MAGTFPILYSNATPSGRSVNVEANLPPNNNAAMIGQAVSNIGGVIGEIGLKIKKAEEASEFSTIHRRLKENFNIEYDALSKTKDVKVMEKIHKKGIEERIGIAGSSERFNVATAAQQSLDDLEPMATARFNSIYNATRINNEIDQLNLNIASAVADGNYTDVEKYVGIAVQSELINDATGEMKLLQAKEDIKKVNNEKLILSTFDSAVLAGSKEKSYEYMDSQDLTSEQKRIIGNKIDDYWEGREKATKKSILNTYEDFSDKLAKGVFTGDDIDFSKLTEAEKKDWKEVLNGYRQESPAAASYDGINSITTIMTDVSTEKLGKGEALKMLADERYVAKTITDADYKFALNKINNPYPVYVIQTINGVLDASKVAFEEKGWGLFSDYIDRGEKKAYTEKTQGFLNWVESESKDGKYPNGEAMYNKMRELGVSVKTPQNLPKPPKAIPKSSDDLYITTQEQANKLPSGTTFYDAVTGTWRIKP